MTLKPTQSAMWLRPPVPPEQRNAFYRGFNAVYGRLEHRYAGVIDRMVHHAGTMSVPEMCSWIAWTWILWVLIRFTPRRQWPRPAA